MSDTCIVCLGDFGQSSTEVPPLFSALANSSDQNAPLQEPSTESGNEPATIPENNNSPTLIAHLQPCGHNLHNDCLTPWVERANSCPICRQCFYLVELTKKIGGEPLFGMSDNIGLL